MADRITLLPDHVANQIAAGEVVQRPASVVKELLENAIDAGAASIELYVKDGGRTLIQVVDDGCGMSPADARMSFRRHATSKIREAADLFKLHTKGFRGEALASIAAIAQVELTTRTDGEELATRIRIAGEDIRLDEPSVGPVGTSISVKNLFFNIPARRNFLKSERVEFRHTLEEFQRVALAHPAVAFSMFHNGSEVQRVPASNHRQRIGHLFGSRMNSRLVPVAEETQLAHISGFICKPEFAKKSRGEQFFFVNDRFFRSSYLHHAVMSAFEGLLKPDTYPGYFLFLQVPTGAIDINIHPTKTEVKFEDEQSLYAILRSAVKHSLGQFSIAPVLDFERDRNLDTPYDFKDRDAEQPRVTVDRDFNPFSGNGTGQKPAAAHWKVSGKGWEALYEGLTGDMTAGPGATDWIIESDPNPAPLFESETRLTGVDGSGPAGIFQLGRKYLLTRIKSGLLLIDQQRAHQRVLYERFLKSTTQAEPVSQALLFPLRLGISPADRHILDSMQDALSGMGFRIALDEGEQVTVSALPAGVPEEQASEVLDGLVAEWQRHGEDPHFSQCDRVAKSLCRSLAVKPGALLETTAQIALVNDLFGCKEPDLSPFNKPIHVTLPLEELDKKFN